MINTNVLNRDLAVLSGLGLRLFCTRGSRAQIPLGNSTIFSTKNYLRAHSIAVPGDSDPTLYCKASCGAYTLYIIRSRMGGKYNTFIGNQTFERLYIQGADPPCNTIVIRTPEAYNNNSKFYFFFVNSIYIFILCIKFSTR